MKNVIFTEGKNTLNYNFMLQGIIFSNSSLIFFNKLTVSMSLSSTASMKQLVLENILYEECQETP